MRRRLKSALVSLALWSLMVYLCSGLRRLLIWGGLKEFYTWVVTLCNLVVEFVRKVVSNWKEHNVRAWRTWVLEDKSSHPIRWLRPYLVPLSLTLAIQNPSGGKRQVVFTNPAGIEKGSFVRPGCPSSAELMGRLPVLPSGY